MPWVAVSLAYPEGWHIGKVEKVQEEKVVVTFLEPGPSGHYRWPVRQDLLNVYKRCTLVKDVQLCCLGTGTSKYWTIPATVRSCLDNKYEEFSDTSWLDLIAEPAHPATSYPGRTVPATRVGGFLPARLQHDLTWNRVTNLRGGPGGNIGLDLINEFLNNDFKDQMKMRLEELGEEMTGETEDQLRDHLIAVGSTTYFAFGRMALAWPTTFTDVPRWFKWDTPSRAFQFGKQRGGFYPCTCQVDMRCLPDFWQCNCHVVTDDNNTIEQLREGLKLFDLLSVVESESHLAGLLLRRLEVSNTCALTLTMSEHMTSLSQQEFDSAMEEAIVGGFYQIKKKYEGREEILPNWRTGMVYHSKKYLMTKGWLDSYAKRFGDAKPNSENVHLPQCATKADMFNIYREDHWEDKDALKETRFMDMWKREFPKLKIPQKNMFTNCDECDALKALLSYAKTKSDIEDDAEEKAEENFRRDMSILANSEKFFDCPLRGGGASCTTNIAEELTAVRKFHLAQARPVRGEDSSNYAAADKRCVEARRKFQDHGKAFFRAKKEESPLKRRRQIFSPGTTPRKSTSVPTLKTVDPAGPLIVRVPSGARRF
ncbi:ATP binding [Branchiostoma belcheri]|nr:ATP binding [Branchiostoma belcheri]